MKTIGERIKFLRINKGLSINKLARELNISPGNLSDIEKNNNTPSTKAVLRISGYMDVSIDWILTGKNFPDSDNSNDTNQIIHIDGDIAAGEPLEMTRKRLKTISVGRGLYYDVNNYMCFRVNGRSMEPNIEHQDIIFIKKDSNWNDKDRIVCAVKLNGEIALKRVIFDEKNKQMFLVSNNKDHSPIIVDPKSSEVVLIGSLNLVIRDVE